MADEAVALNAVPGGGRIEVAGGRQYAVDAVALAVGNYPPSGETPGHVANPWDPAALAAA